MKIIFWLSILWIIYTYIGYMAVLKIITLFIREKSVKGQVEPFVTMIIAAFNEEKSIVKKIHNCFELDYPKGKLEVIIVSDASSDKTDELASSYTDRGIKLLRMKQRAGKTAAQNHAVSKAQGDILVFSDATTMYKQDAIRKLVSNFGDKRIGIVAGEEHFTRSQDNSMFKEVSFSWKYERMLRRLESKFYSLIGVSGCIFAIRKNLYTSLNENLIEDFALPLIILEKGYKARLEKGAIAYEKPVSKAKDEFERKTRIVSGGMNVMFTMRRLLNPFKYPRISFQLISHKIFRWLAPIFLIGLFGSTIFLLGEGVFYKLFFAAQAACYGLAILGFVMGNGAPKAKIVKIPFYFCLVNVAVFLGIVKYLIGEKKVQWEPIR